ncbi:MAG TPA: PepSY domain-containing protein [Alphaproteobacteria bacterium]|nr:PepSY domain-containing protein [Alphaproteobacteria bacterium]
MKKLLIPAMGAVAAIGATQPASADVLVSQLMIQGQPGYTGTVNRTVTPGSPGIAPLNTPVGPSPFTVAPPPAFTPSSPFIGQRGELNTAEREYVGPGEPDASGKIGPTVDRTRARFAGERGPDGKLLPTYAPEQRAQATPQATPQMSPQTPAPSDMQRSQPPATSTQPGATQRRPGSGAMTTPSDQSTSPSGTTTDRSMQQNQSTQQRQQRTQMQGDRQRSGAQTQSRTGSRNMNEQEMSETKALNTLAAEGYTNIGRIERVGNTWQATATKEGKQVTVQVDPQTNRVMER